MSTRVNRGRGRPLPEGLAPITGRGSEIKAALSGVKISDPYVLYN